MTRELELIRNLLRPVDKDAVPAERSPMPGFGSAFSFRYSVTEVTARRDGTHVRRQETRFENGRLVKEEAEGMLDVGAYNEMVAQSQRLVVEQMRQVMRLFFLPFGGYRRDD